MCNSLLIRFLMVFVLLFAQQAGAAHALRHALKDLAQQQNKQAPHSPACEQCAAYAQLGSALNNIGAQEFMPLALSDVTAPHHAIPFHSIHALPAVARGPPQPARIA